MKLSLLLLPLLIRDKNSLVLQAAEEEATAVVIGTRECVVRGHGGENVDEIQDTCTFTAKRAVGDAEKRKNHFVSSFVLNVHSYSHRDDIFYFCCILDVYEVPRQ